MSQAQLSVSLPLPPPIPVPHEDPDQQPTTTTTTHPTILIPLKQNCQNDMFEADFELDSPPPPVSRKRLKEECDSSRWSGKESEECGGSPSEPHQEKEVHGGFGEGPFAAKSGERRHEDEVHGTSYQEQETRDGGRVPPECPRQPELTGHSDKKHPRRAGSQPNQLPLLLLPSSKRGWVKILTLPQISPRQRDQKVTLIRGILAVCAYTFQRTVSRSNFAPSAVWQRLPPPRFSERERETVSSVVS